MFRGNFLQFLLPTQKYVGLSHTTLVTTAQQFINEIHTHVSPESNMPDNRGVRVANILRDKISILCLPISYL